MSLIVSKLCFHLNSCLAKMEIHVGYSIFTSNHQPGIVCVTHDKVKIVRGADYRRVLVDRIWDKFCRFVIGKVCRNFNHFMQFSINNQRFQST